MANRFARGFEQTFGPSFLRGQETAEAGRKASAKEQQELQDFDTLVSAIGEDRLESVGLSEDTLTAIRSSSKPTSALKSFFEIRDIQQKLPTETEKGRFTGRGVSPGTTQRPLDRARGLVSTVSPAGGIAQALDSQVQPRIAQAAEDRFRVTKEVQKSPSGLTTRTVEPIETEQELNKELEGLADEKFVSAIATKSIDRLFKSQEQKTNFIKVTGLMSRLISQVKGAGEEQGGLGLLPGAVGALGVFFKFDKFGRTSAVAGQITEATFALNSILTGQNRVIKGVTERISATLAGRFDPSTFVASKTSQTIRNSFILSKAIEKAGITPEVLAGLKGRKIKFGGREVEEIDLSEIGIDIEKVIAGITLSDEEEEELDAVIKTVLASPATKREDLPGKDADKFKNVPVQTTPSGVEFQLLR